jgi:hypothetical protein
MTNQSLTTVSDPLSAIHFKVIFTIMFLVVFIFAFFGKIHLISLCEAIKSKLRTINVDNTLKYHEFKNIKKRLVCFIETII